ncbi:MAG TPA: hypothetical protein PKY05_00310 [Fibrobacteria bacterium]|nr:hypothetical protein [Fibrobacteria bacterium]
MKTNFQNGTLVTPAFLNAINSPVWKQVPANDGEFKPPALTDMPDVEQAIADAVEVERLRAVAAEAAFSWGVSQSYSNKTVFADTDGSSVPSSTSLIQVAKSGNFYRLFGWAEYMGAPADDSGIFGTFHIDSDPNTILREVASLLFASSQSFRFSILVHHATFEDVPVPIKLDSPDGIKLAFSPYVEVGRWRGYGPHLWWSFDLIF